MAQAKDTKAWLKGKDDQKTLTRVVLKLKIDNAEARMETLLSRYLLSNTRRDRDALLKKREELKTYKTLMNDEFFQSTT